MNKRTKHVIAAVLAFVLFFEPIAVQAVRAAETKTNGELPEPTVITEDAGLMDPDDILAPHDYLEQMLDFRGHNQQEVELRAWGEWQELINSAYLVIDEGATDVFGLYDALTIMKTVKSTTCSVGDVIGNVAKYAHMTAAFMEKLTKTNRAKTALSCWSRMNKWTEKCVELCKKSKSLDFLSFCCPPTSWHNAKNTAKGMDQYWHWLQKKGGKDVNTELTNAQGIARSIGIGFAVIGTVLAVWTYAKNEDTQVGRWSYDRTKKLVAVGLAAAGIVAMFCIPIVGQVLAIITAIWGVITYFGDMIGEFNKQWKNAYKNSYWYLYENDPEFKSFYDNRDLLVDDEKSASLIQVEQNYGEFKVASATAATDDEDDTEARNARIYTALEKNGVLASYYNKSGHKMPSMTLDELMELWEMKANYMAWKPSEKEANTKRNFFQKIGHIFNPKTAISWVADKFASKGYKDMIEENNIERVYFNPDFILMKKYQNFVTANRLVDQDEFYRAVGLRIEQSPFNYIPLVGIDTSKWNIDLFHEAFACDSFIVGQKEMAALHNQFELAVESLDDSIDETDKLIKKLDKNEIPHAKKVREFLDDFAKAYKSDPKKVNKKLFNKADDLMEFEWDKKKDKTPENLLEACHDSLEKALMYEPLALSQKGAEMVLLTITVKQHLDMATLMNAYIDEKWQALKTFDQDFKNEDFKLYLKEGTFLNVKGKTFLDWLAELYPAYEDAEKTLKLMEKDVEKYNKLADKGASDKRTAFLWFKKSVATPIELVEKINDELEEWKNTIEAWSEISSDANVKVVLAENTEFAEKVLGKYDVSKFRLESLDPDDDSVEDIDLPPYVLSDSLAVEGAADVLLGD